MRRLKISESMRNRTKSRDLTSEKEATAKYCLCLQYQSPLMEEIEEQANPLILPKQPQVAEEGGEPEPMEIQQNQPVIEYFIPPPINYLNNKYYQHFQDSDNFIHQFTDKFVCFDEELSLNHTPPDVPIERPITLKLKEELSQRNREIFNTMQRILAHQARLTTEESLNGLQEELKAKMHEFLEICARAKVAEIRHLTLRRIESETSSIVERTRELKEELQEIKGELSSHRSLAEQE